MKEGADKIQAERKEKEAAEARVHDALEYTAGQGGSAEELAAAARAAAVVSSSRLRRPVVAAAQSAAPKAAATRRQPAGDAPLTRKRKRLAQSPARTATASASMCGGGGGRLSSRASGLFMAEGGATEEIVSASRSTVAPSPAKANMDLSIPEILAGGKLGNKIQGVQQYVKQMGGQQAPIHRALTNTPPPARLNVWIQGFGTRITCPSHRGGGLEPRSLGNRNPGQPCLGTLSES